MVASTDFEQLQFKDKIKFIKAHGRFLASRTEARFSISLFQVDSFFTDVWYDNENLEHVVIHTFCDTAYLAPYLYQLDIKELTEQHLA